MGRGGEGAASVESLSEYGSYMYLSLSGSHECRIDRSSQSGHLVMVDVLSIRHVHVSAPSAFRGGSGGTLGGTRDETQTVTDCGLTDLGAQHVEIMMLISYVIENHDR